MGIFRNFRELVGFDAAPATSPYVNQPSPALVAALAAGIAAPALGGAVGAGDPNPFDPQPFLVSGTTQGVSSPLMIPQGTKIVFVDTSVARTLQLPKAPTTGYDVLVVDITGGANANPITIQTQGNDLVNGGSSTTMNTPFGVIKFLYGVQNGTALPSYSITGQPNPLSLNPLPIRKVATTATVTLQPNEFACSVDTAAAGAATTVKLPAAPKMGSAYLVYDESGAAAASPITVSLSGTDAFAAGALVPTPGTRGSTAGADTIRENFGARLYSFDGSYWSVSLTPRNIRRVRTLLTTATTLDESDDFVLFGGTSTFTLTMPPNPRPGQVITVKEASVGNSGTLTITANAGQKIQKTTGAVSAAAGSITQTGTTGISLSFVYDSAGATWWGFAQS